MEQKAKADIERRQHEDMDPDDLLNLLDEMGSHARPRQSDQISLSDTRKSGDSTPRKIVQNPKVESEIETLGIANSRRRPRTALLTKGQSFDSRPNSAPQDTGKTLLKAKTVSIEPVRDSSSSSRPSITKVLAGGEIRQIPEEDQSEESSRPIDLNDRDVSAKRSSPVSLEPNRTYADKQETTRRIAQAVNEERERLKTEHMKELEAKDARDMEQMEAQKRLFETQIASLEAVIKHQETLGALSSAVSANADTLNSLSAKFHKEKTFNDQVKVQEFASKQKSVLQLEQRLLAQQQIMEMDKQHMLEVIKRVQDEELMKNAVMEQEREELKKDREQLHKFQDFLRDQDRTRKEEHLLDKQKLELLRESLAREHAEKMQELSEQASELKIKQTLFEQRKTELEQQELSNRTALQQKFAQLEQMRGQITEMEAKAARKMMEAEEKDRSASSEWDKLQRGMNALQLDKAQLEDEAQKLHQLSLAVQNKSLEIAQMRADLDKEQEDALHQRQEAQFLLSTAKAESNRLEAQKRELSTSMKSYEKMRYGLVKDLQNEGNGYSKETTLAPLLEIQQKLTELTQQRPMSSYGVRKPTFTAAKYMKDLQGYDQARGEFQSYVTAESQMLLKTKLEMETGFSESLAASLHGPGDVPSQDQFRWRESDRSVKDLTGSALSG